MMHAVEAVLFAAGKYLEEEYIAKVLQEDKRKVKKALEELREDYEKRPDCAIRVSHEGTQWKLAVRDEYMGIASKLISDKEIATTVLESLAVIAWKNPIQQAELIKIRGPSAYEHIAELVERGFVTKVPEKRSFKLTLQQKFFDYFDVTGREDMKKLFAPIEEQAGAAQAEIDQKQAAYDARIQAAQNGLSGASTPVPEVTTVPQPSAQVDLITEAKGLAEQMKVAEQLGKQDAAATPDAKPVVASKVADKHGDPEFQKEAAEIEEAVKELSEEVKEIRDETKKH